MSDKRTLTAATAENQRESTPKRLPDTVRGVLAGFSAEGEPLVDFCTNTSRSPVTAASTVAVQESDLGREVILLFEDGDPARPIVIGLLQLVRSDRIQEKKSKAVELIIDGKSLKISAEKEIVLRCGEASITLTRTGKILIRGTYLLSRSTGPNRIKGGSVQLN